MEVQMWIAGLLVLASVFQPAEAMPMYDPQLCYILDGFLGLYGLIITGMFIKEKFFKTKVKATGDDSIYTDLMAQGAENYAPLVRRDPESGGRRRADDSTYTALQKQGGDEYKELPVKRERQRKNDQVYQGLSSATRDTYQSLQMQPLPAR
ncbi:T-cell surface glycoprotein CD3 zeta chain [Anabas testudineus]|uniref:T-cell surface glycoprotein CD3 zeta chain n=1 Tax=Anabas testudineus TaxID=64144 RepID=A0A7N6FHH3_ANATE|nr:T-cell surface glycoprotein CD3 zeta chain [Anabas testudineus]